MTNPLVTSASGLRRWSAATLAAFTLVLSSCATLDSGPEAELVDRAEARWAAVMANDLEAAYGFYSPGYRSATSLIDFGVEMRLRRVQWTSAEYMDRSCETDRCTVRFKVGYRVVAPVPGMKVWDSYSVVKETWVRTRGEWWYLPEK